MAGDTDIATTSDDNVLSSPETESTIADSSTSPSIEAPAQIESDNNEETNTNSPSNVLYTPSDPRFMDSLFSQESSGEQSAIGPLTSSGDHAIGIGQIMPATFKDFAKPGEDIHNEEDNRNVSKRVLESYYNKYKDPKLALAAYNAGPGTIDRYLKRTKNGTFDEVFAEMEKDNSYSETRAYVPGVLGKYEKAIGKQSPGLQTGPPQEVGALPQGRGTRKEFADTLLQQVSTPDFDTMSAPEQIKTLAQTYNSRKWEPEAYDTLKKTATAIWETASPEDQPNFAEIVGSPPITPDGADVGKVTDAWKTDAIQKVIKAGISPALFGDQLDNYLNQAVQNETESYTARNRSTVGWALNRSGNLIREGAKGALGIVTGAAGGAVRLTGAPFGKGQETADAIENIPTTVLGVPARDFLYNTDENGELTLNPDGTPQMHWQAQVAEGIGMIGGTIGTLGIGAELGVSSKVLAATNISANTLNMAGSSFKNVYNQTGSLSKAYSAAAFSIPAAAIQSVSELGIVSGAFSPTLKGLSVYDKARFLAQSFSRNAAIGASTTAAADIIQQYGETRQTGEEISGKRTAIAAATGGLGAGIAGSAFDYIRGIGEVRASVRPSEALNSGKELTDFRDSLEPNKTVNVKPESIKKSEADLLGIEVTPTQNGGVTLSKKTDIALKEVYTPEELPELINTLNSQPTPKEIEVIAKEHSELAAKPIKTPAETERLTQLSNTLESVSRPEYQNNIKAVENKVSQVLEQDPGALPVRRDTTDHTWEHVETGKKASFLKDLLKPEEIKTSTYENDLSDISHIGITDEDTLLKTGVTEEDVAAHKESIVKSQENLTALETNKNALQEEVNTLGKANKQNEVVASQRAKIQGKIDVLTKQKEALPEVSKIEKPTNEANDFVVKAREDLNNTKSKILELQNKKALAKDKATSKDLQNQIRELQITERSLRSSILKKAGERVKELSAKKAYENVTKRNEQLTQERQTLNEKIAKHQKDLETKKVTEMPGLKEKSNNLSATEKALEEANKLHQELKNGLQEKIKKNKEFEKAKGRVAKIGTKGLGAIVTSKGKSEIIIPKGLGEEAKAQITAHEVAHAITDKLNLPAETNLAIENRLFELKSKASLVPASEMAKEVFLPEVNKNVKIPEGTTVKGLEKESQDALLSKREFLANQVGALILKRAGKDIGGYKILPELEEALSKTKLPEIGVKNEPKQVQLETPTKDNQQPVIKEEDIPKQNVSISNIPETPKKPVEPLPLNPKTGQKGETAFSKTVREEVPERPATEYEKVSRIKGSEEARKYVEDNGTDHTLKLLQDKQSFSTNPEQKILLTDALLNKVKDEFAANPTPENNAKLYEADQLRAAVGTSAAQQLALLQRFRNTSSFADFIVQARKAYVEAGFDAPEFTEFQLKELKALYDNAQGLPEGVLRNDKVQKMWEKALETKNLSWPDFLKSYMQTNLLSGIGTGVINTAGGLWMSPVFTALSHPFFGRGLIWKTMFNVLGVAKANAVRVLEGKGANELYGGLMDPSAIKVTDNSTYPRMLASIYNKFGRGLHRVLSASDTFMKTTGGEGYLAVKKYQALQEKYANNPDKLYAEAGKIALSKDALQSAMLQADKEGKTLGLEFSEADKMVRAYEIIRRADTSPEMLKNAADWADVTSLRGDIANPIQDLLHKALYNAQVWQNHPLLGSAKTVVLPFGRAILKISDFAMDLIPGNIFLDKGSRYLGGKLKGEALPERSPALQDRLRRGQYIGTALAVTGMGLARAGLVQITGDEEQVLGSNKGEAAKTGAQFKEFEQKGLPPYSIVFPNGYALSYKDLPGLNAIMYGVYKANKSLDEGVAIPYAATEFFRNAYASAIPFLGSGGSTLNSPYVSLINGILDPEASGKHIQDSFQKVATSVAKMTTPASSLLSDVKKIYDSTPEESNQSLTISMFKDIPGVSELLGSKPKLNRFGEPVERTALERTPGVGRIVEQVKTPSDEVAKKLIEKGIIVPELGRTVKFNKSDYPSAQFQEKYEATREERVGKSYSNSFTPDEWYNFIKATGPYIKTVANQIASSSMPTDKAQDLLIKRTRMIEEQAKKRFIRTGQF